MHVMFLNLNSFTGNYIEAIDDSKFGTELQPTLSEAYRRGRNLFKHGKVMCTDN